MNSKILLAGTLLISAGYVMAQETIETPRAEVGFNYSYVRVNPGSGLGSYNENGGFGDIEYNLNRHLGLVADVGANYIGTANGLRLDNTSFEYLFGPRFNVRHGRFNPYFQALFGGQRFSNGWNPVASNPSLGVSQNNFAMAFGGGLNVALSDHLALRPIQVDYFVTEIAPGSTNYVQNNLRYSAGVIFRLGSK